MSDLLVVTESNFKSEVLESKVPVALAMKAVWCPPCVKLQPTLEELDKESDATYLVAKVDVDDSPKLASTYGVKSIPTILCFKNGEVTGRLVGLQSKEAILALLQA